MVGWLYFFVYLKTRKEKNRMARIRVLPANIANKIAAGEVVDRPASVVKELVENSLDAGATEITVVIAQAGKELIQVIDNGCGMEPRDAELAFERHATSKIQSVQDLDRIATLGFRGEALPSIASVSRLEVKTCPLPRGEGTVLRLEGGKVLSRHQEALHRGTTISVKHLFYNTPARRSFLKADTTEFNHILKVLKRFFLAYPEVHFVLIHNQEELFNLPRTTLDQRIVQVFGEKFYQGLVYVREEMNEVRLDGYVCKPDCTRGNTENQFIFLNRRAVLNRHLAHAVFQGYGNLIERSRYPQFMLFLHIPPHLVDVNVHPTKMEVRFANERVVYHLFLSAVRKAVQSRKIVPHFDLSGDDPHKKEIRHHFQRMRQFRRPLRRAVQGRSDAGADTQLTLNYTVPTAPEESSRTPDFLAPETGDEDQASVQANLWQVHNRYIFSQIKSGLVIIDQHVAHERVLYERVLNALAQNRSVPSQQLLFPQTLELSLEDFLIFSDIKEWLEKIGFSVTELSGRTILIEAIPADVKVGYEGKILLEILDYYRENEDKNYQPHEKIAAAFACRNAIKSGEKLSLEAMNALVDQLFATREPFFCPHGRPVIVNLTLDELDKKFKRVK